MATQKTLKREWGVFLVVITLGFGLWGSLGNPQAMEVFKTLVMPIISFNGLAFGMDAYAKQI